MPAENVPNTAISIAWTPLTLPAKVETIAGEAAEGRIDAEGHLELKGKLKVKAGEEVKSGELLATLPAALRFGARLFVVASVREPHNVVALQIEAGNGQITSSSENFPSGFVVGLDNIRVTLV